MASSIQLEIHGFITSAELQNKSVVDESLMKKILIIGKLPSPIGGVTIHVKRLLEHFEGDERIEFLDLNNTGKIEFLFRIFKFRYLHLHSSNIYFRFILSVICLITFRRLIITVHGNLGRYKPFKNFIDYCSVTLCFIPIVINADSLKKAERMNKNSVLIPAFLEPLVTEPLNADLLHNIERLRLCHRSVFCTNAYRFTLDKDAEEIYGIDQLVKIFTLVKHQSLIISDPSGDYKKYFENNKVILPSNVMLISYEHDFFEVLKLSDAFIRNTTTDGDSLSLKEALYLNKSAFATNIVDRPSGCIIYTKSDNLHLQNLLDEFYPLVLKGTIIQSGFKPISELYAKLLNSYSDQK